MINKTAIIFATLFHVGILAAWKEFGEGKYYNSNQTAPMTYLIIEKDRLIVYYANDSTITYRNATEQNWNKIQRDIETQSNAMLPINLSIFFSLRNSYNYNPDSLPTLEEAARTVPGPRGWRGSSR